MKNTLQAIKRRLNAVEGMDHDWKTEQWELPQENRKRRKEFQKMRLEFRNYNNQGILTFIS